MTTECAMLRDIRELIDSPHVMFLARGKVGPFRVETEPMTGADGTVAVRVLMRDEGNGDRLITTASYQFRSV